MLKFNTKIHKFGNHGEKTGWTYIEISDKQAKTLNPNVKVSFRVKGYLDKYPFSQMALLPMGGGFFILPLKAYIRRKIRKGNGDMLVVILEVDNSEIAISTDLLKCLESEPECLNFFQSLSPSHQKYFSKWIEQAKLLSTKTKRIAQAIEGFSKKQGFSEMMRANKFQSSQIADFNR